MYSNCGAFVQTVPTFIKVVSMLCLSLASQAIFHGRKWAGRSEGKIRLVTIARFSWYAGISGIP